MFSLLGIGDAWLDLPTVEWPHDHQHTEIKNIVQDLAVINDTAERGVKDIQIYTHAALDGDQRYMILVSSSHCVRLPEFLKMR